MVSGEATSAPGPIRVKGGPGAEELAPAFGALVYILLRPKSTSYWTAEILVATVYSLGI